MEGGVVVGGDEAGKKLERMVMSVLIQSLIILEPVYS